MKRRDFLYSAGLGGAALFGAAPLLGAGRPDSPRGPGGPRSPGSSGNPGLAGTPAPLADRASIAADFVLRGAVLYDGSGAPPVEAEVAVQGGRIAAVARSVSSPGAAGVDLRGLALAPGFVDIHAHTDLVLLADGRAESKVRQGVTTEVAGADGSSIGPWSEAQARATAEDYRSRYGARFEPFRDLGGFFRALEAAGMAVNLASMVGAGTIRGFVIGQDDRTATGDEIARMTALVREGLAHGAVGLSSGLEYTPGAFADAAELAALASALRGTGLPYASHMRNEDDRLLAAVEEAIDVGRAAGVPVQISHLKAQGERNWWKTDPAFATIEGAHAAGIDVRFDVYPYVAYSTGLSNLFPIWARDGGTAAFLARLQDPARLPRIEAAVRDKVAQLGSWDAVQITGTGSAEFAWARGRRFGQLATERGHEPFALLLHLMIADRARPGMVGFGMSEQNVERKLAHPLSIVVSDGGARATDGPLAGGSVHPRAYGTFPRVLGHYVRDRRIMPLETAIAKMTSMPAERVGLRDRGRVAEGFVADLVAFDPDTVRDTATFEQPHAYPVGIPHVWVAGHAVIADGEHSGARPGRVIRGTAARG
jgi:N-acyl-D-amino-acid deacylase